MNFGFGGSQKSKHCYPMPTSIDCPSRMADITANMLRELKNKSITFLYFSIRCTMLWKVHGGLIITTSNLKGIGE
jgi:hypothetical protein